MQGSELPDIYKRCNKCGERLARADRYCPFCHARNANFSFLLYKVICISFAVPVLVLLLTVVFYAIPFPYEVEGIQFVHQEYRLVTATVDFRIFDWYAGVGSIWDVFWMRIAAAALLLALSAISVVGIAKKKNTRVLQRTVKTVFPILVLASFAFNLIGSILELKFDNVFWAEAGISVSLPIVDIFVMVNLIVTTVSTELYLLWWGLSYRSFGNMFRGGGFTEH